jgi:hypothetical protein
VLQVPIGPAISPQDRQQEGHEDWSRLDQATLDGAEIDVLIDWHLEAVTDGMRRPSDGALAMYHCQRVAELHARIETTQQPGRA